MAIDQDAGLEVGMMYALVTMGWAGVCPDGWEDAPDGYCAFTAGLGDDGGGLRPDEATPIKWELTPEEEAAKHYAPNFTLAVSALAGLGKLKGFTEGWGNYASALTEAVNAEEVAYFEQPETFDTRITNWFTTAGSRLGVSGDWVQMNTNHSAIWLVYFAALKYEISTAVASFGGSEATILQVEVQVLPAKIERFESCLMAIVEGASPFFCRLDRGDVRLPTAIVFRPEGGALLSTRGSPWAPANTRSIIDPCNPAPRASIAPSPMRTDTTDVYIPKDKGSPQDTKSQQACTTAGLAGLKRVYIWGQHRFFSYVRRH